MKKTAEQRLEASIKKLENIVKRASDCRHNLGLISCYQCEHESTCKSFDFDDHLTLKRMRSKELEQEVGTAKAWMIEQKYRDMYMKPQG